jgi:hypothetical protein
MQSFSYKNKGFMAEIGKRTAVANIFGRNLHGLVAWMIWRSFYLSGLPTLKKKARVLTDWNADLLFGHDVTMIKMLAHRRSYFSDQGHNSSQKTMKPSEVGLSSPHMAQKNNNSFNSEREGKSHTTHAA